jgi:capsule biosynthesis phosphatase
MPVNYIICSAGYGSRFEKDFPGLPKPMIKLFGRYLLEWALDSLTIFPEDNLIIITQKKQEVEKSLGKLIENRFKFASVSWIELDHVTSGQLETALSSEEYINFDGSIAIFNCDTFFQTKNLSNLMNDPNIDGVIPCSKESGNSWSFCKVDEELKVLEVAEKNRISDWCSVGLYYFRDARLFFDKAKKYIQTARVGETYVAPFYQEYLNEKKNIMMDPVVAFKPMGTPDQIENYWDIAIEALVQENFKKVLVFDIDDTLTIDNSSKDYRTKEPRTEVIKKLQEYKQKGYKIILHTARRMKTYSNDEAKVVANISQITLDWLNHHQVPYDGIKFGKPHAENGFYVDDKTIRPDEFLKLTEDEIFNLLS